MKRHIVFLLFLSLLAVSAYAGTATVNLGTAGNFGLLAGTTVTNIGSSVIWGDVGVSPGSAVTGFPPELVHGTLYTADNADTAATAQAQLDLTTAYDQAAGATPTLDLTGTDLSFYNAANPLGPGVYSFSSDAQLTGNLTLQGTGSANDEWIFQIGKALTTGTDSSVALINGATKCKVFWQIGSSATLGTRTAFAGNILALTSIGIDGYGTLNGRALARNGAVTISSAETVDSRPCGAAPAVPEPSSMALVMTSIPAVAALLRRKK